jgi:glycogen operon protein
MLSGGDEVGRTQGGNNNAYCQDNDLAWTPWDVPSDGRALSAFIRRLVALRKSQPVLRRRTFLTGRSGDPPDVLWLDPNGVEMTEAGWADPGRRALGMLLDGEAIPETNASGERVRGDTLLILLSADAGPVRFTLPERRNGSGWEQLIDTNDPEGPAHVVPGGTRLTLAPHSARVLRLTTG